MKMSDTWLHPGGLFRCCLGSLREKMQADPGKEVKTGDVMESECRCLTIIKLHEDTWKWDKYNTDAGNFSCNEE